MITCLTFRIMCRFHTHWTGTRVRETFLEFFKGKYGYTFVPSSSVNPGADTSLLFVNAGMNQFKPVLLGEAAANSHFASLRTAVNSQKCIRVGGKHNDLADVGNDSFHHTFFEMLGNWSFRGYFSKRDACEQAWELLTKVYCLPVERLFVTYFGGEPAASLPCDEETHSIWRDIIGVQPDHIVSLGMKDNFWEMGATGPCGPCTEIHYSPIGSFHQSREIWNLVFIQYNRTVDGSLSKLDTFHVDTGLGLERLTAIMQGGTSNYTTDLFQPIMAHVGKLLCLPQYVDAYGIEDSAGINRAYRILSDHARMFSVAMADGVMPSARGRGYVLRKILRNAAYESFKLNAKSSLLSELVPAVVTSLGSAYPELKANESAIVDTVFHQTDEYKRVLRRGRRLFKKWLEKERNFRQTISRDDMLTLRDVHGLPSELVQQLATENRLSIDISCASDVV